MQPQLRCEINIKVHNVIAKATQMAIQNHVLDQEKPWYK